MIRAEESKQFTRKTLSRFCTDCGKIYPCRPRDYRMNVFLCPRCTQSPLLRGLSERPAAMQ
jgi:hypothetical protein